jgi:hypothetical protein
VTKRDDGNPEPLPTDPSDGSPLNALTGEVEIHFGSEVLPLGLRRPVASEGTDTGTHKPEHPDP